MEVTIPQFGDLSLEFLVLDFTGTLSINGRLIPGVAERLIKISRLLKIYVLTADTFGRAREELAELPLTLNIITGHAEDAFKAEFVINLGAPRVVAMGNGNNDVLMLKKAGLGVAVIEGEGCSSAAIMAADLSVRSILDGLDLLLEPLRIKAGLRS
ncbi:MAG: HAD hydrolase family protein [Deltaproteobacteria bacterium]|nr:HAD hydrolase family protein [Deltaproteobacteria bacterium]